MQQRIKAPHVRMTVNKTKIFEAILFLLSEADKTKYSISQYDIVKSIFLADKQHLKVYGRPITFDNYVAMKHGPVPSFTYDLLKDKVNWLQKFSLKQKPWETVKAGSSSAQYYSLLDSKPNLENLSVSDKDALSRAFEVVQFLGFGQIRKLTHEDPAYVDAWEDDGDCKAYPMSYMLFFDVPSEEKAIELSFASEYS